MCTRYTSFWRTALAVQLLFLLQSAHDDKVLSVRQFLCREYSNYKGTCNSTVDRGASKRNSQRNTFDVFLRLRLDLLTAK